MILSEATQADNDDAPPRVSHELIEFLEQTHRIDAWKAARTYDEVARLQGAHEVIDLLKTLYARQIGEHDVLLDGHTGATPTGSASGDT